MSKFYELIVDTWEWREQAACRGMDTALFFGPDIGDGQGAANGSSSWVAEAKRVCCGCPVAVDCAEQAVANNEPYGVFGGLSRSERRYIAGSLPPSHKVPRFRIVPDSVRERWGLTQDMKPRRVEEVAPTEPYRCWTTGVEYPPLSKSGAMTHYRKGEKPCEPCRKHKNWNARRYHASKAKTQQEGAAT